MNSNHKLLRFLDKLIMVFISTLVITFILYPFLAVFKESIFDKNNNFSMALIFDFLGKDMYLLKNSIFVALITSVFSTVISVFIAIYHYITGERIKKILASLLMITMISPPFVTSLSYINLFGRRGFISHDILGLTFNPYGWHGIVLMQSLGSISLNSLILIGFLKSLDRTPIYSAISLGAKSNNIISDILLPLMKPGILVVAILGFIRSTADFGTPAIIGGAFKVLASEGYFSVISQGDIKKAAAINIVLFIPAIFAFIFYIRTYKNTSFSNHGDSSYEVGIERSGLFYNIAKIVSLVFIFWLALQYASIFVSAFTSMAKGKRYFSFNNIIESIPYISKTFVRSIVYSLIAGAVSTIIGLLLVYYSQTRKLKWFRYMDFIATMPYIVPGTFFGLGYLFAFSHPPIQLVGTAAIVILNVTFKQLPFSTKVAGANMSQINPELLDSTRDLGGSRIHELKDVIFPLSKQGIYIGFVNGFTATMTTIGSIIFIIYPRQKVATLVMFDVIQSGKYGIGSVIACLIILICVVVNGGYYLIMQRKRG